MANIIGKELSFKGNIKYLKQLVLEAEQLKNGDRDSFSKHIQDMMFEIETSYQSYFHLEPDDWGISPHDDVNKED